MKMRRKMRTTILLIAIFMTSIFAMARSTAQGTVIIAGEEEITYPTIQEAIDAASEGDTIIVGSGEWYGGIVDKPLRIIGMKGAIIVDGPAYPCFPYQQPPLDPEDYPGSIGFYINPEGKGSTISDFTFRGGYTDKTEERWLYMAIFARLGADGVTFTHNKITNCGQCITFRDCDDWTVTHNTIKGHFKEPGESFGFMTGIYFGTIFDGHTSTGNFIAYNEITTNGALVATGIHANSKKDCDPEHVFPGALPGCPNAYFTGTPGQFKDNTILLNRIKVKGESAVALKMTFTCMNCSGSCFAEIPGRPSYPEAIIHDNIFQYNDFRGSTTCYEFNPEKLDCVNLFLDNQE